MKNKTIIISYIILVGVFGAFNFGLAEQILTTSTNSTSNLENSTSLSTKCNSSNIIPSDIVGETNIKKLQQILVNEGYLKVQPTGYFGQLTKNALKAFQGNNDLPPTGYFGNMTLNLIKQKFDCSEKKQIITVKTSYSTTSTQMVSSSDNNHASSSTALIQSGGENNISNVSYSTTSPDSLIVVSNDGILNLDNVTISTYSNYNKIYEPSATVIAKDSSTIKINKSTILSSGIGANNIFSTDENSEIYLSDNTISTLNNNSYNIVAAQKGVVNIKSGNYSTKGDDSSVIVIKNGEGEINTIKDGGKYLTAEGDNSNVVTVMSSGGKVNINDGTYFTARGENSNVFNVDGYGGEININGGGFFSAEKDNSNVGIIGNNGGKININGGAFFTANGDRSSVFAVKNNRGRININNGAFFTAEGEDSVVLYSAGNITVSKGGRMESKKGEIAVIEDGGSITFNNPNLASSDTGRPAITIRHRLSDSNDTCDCGTGGKLSMQGGDFIFESASSPIFYVDNSIGTITLSKVNFKKEYPDTILLKSSKGSKVVLKTNEQTLIGNVIADSKISVYINLQNKSSLTGAINNARSGKEVSIILDSSSKVTLTADSYINAISGAVISGEADSITNIIGNGNNLYYDSTNATNSVFGRKTYKLSNGGYLLPK